MASFDGIEGLVDGLEGLVDGLAGRETLAQLATSRGVHFGAATGGTDRLADTEYMQFCLDHSNCLTSLSGFYPSNLQPSEGVFDFANANALIALRGGRPLTSAFSIYHGATPTWMANALSSETWEGLIDDHVAGIASLTQHLDGKIVTNETISPTQTGWRDTIWAQAASPEIYVPYALQRERAYNPNAKLFICENLMEPVSHDAKRASLLAQVDDLMEVTQGGSPVLDGVCLQSHLETGFPFTGAGYDNLLHELITVRGLEVRVTEFDVRNSGMTDLGAFDKLAAEWTYRFFSMTLEAGVRFYTCWDIRNDWSWLHEVVPGFTQRPLPYLADGRPSQIERAIRAALT